MPMRDSPPTPVQTPPLLPPPLFNARCKACWLTRGVLLLGLGGLDPGVPVDPAVVA